MPNQTKALGDQTEAKVLAALVGIFPAVLVPFGDNQRYDLVFQAFDGTFKRVQCKTGKIRNGVIEFNTYSLVGTDRRSAARVSYVGEIEFFGVSCPGDSSVYLIPIEDIATLKSACILRLEPGKQTNSRTRWASKYLL